MRSEISEAARAYTYPIRCCSRGPSSLDDISAPSHRNAIAAPELTAPPMTAPSGPPKRKPVAVPAIPEKPPPAISVPRSIRRRIPAWELTGSCLSAVTLYSLAVAVSVSYPRSVGFVRRCRPRTTTDPREQSQRTVRHTQAFPRPPEPARPIDRTRIVCLRLRMEHPREEMGQNQLCRNGATLTLARSQRPLQHRRANRPLGYWRRRSRVFAAHVVRQLGVGYDRLTWKLSDRRLSSRQRLRQWRLACPSAAAAAGARSCASWFSGWCSLSRDAPARC